MHVERFGRLIVHHRWWWLAGVLALTGLFLFNIPNLTLEDDETTWYSAGDPTLEIYQAFEDRFESDDLIVIGYQWQAPYSPQALSYLATLSERLEKEVPYVDGVTSLTSVDDIVGTATALEVRPLVDADAITSVNSDALRHRIAINPFLRGNLVSEDEQAVAIAVELQLPEGGDDEAITSEILRSVRTILAEEEAATGLRFYKGGARVTDSETEDMLQRDMDRFFPLTLIFTAVILLVFFRHLPSVILPLATVLVSLGWTLGLKTLVGSPITPVSTTLFALITVIGIADSVHLISQYWHEKSTGKTREAVLLATYRRAGKPCLLTSLTTAVGFASLIVSRVPAIRHLGCFAAFGIMSAFFLSMVLVPLGMDLVSHRRPHTPRNRWLEQLLAGIGRFNLARPCWVLVGSLAITVGMAIGIFFIQSEGSMVEYFKPRSDFRQAVDFFDRNLSGISSTEVILYGERDAFKEPDVLRRMDRLQEAAVEHPHVTAAVSLADTLKLISRALHGDDPDFYTIPDTKRAVSQSMLLYEMSGGADLRDYVSGDYATARVSIRTRQMRDRERAALLADVRAYVDEAMPEFRAEVTGMDLLVSEVNNRIVLTQIQSFALAMGVITVMMILTFGLRAGLASILPNIVPIVFVLGLMGYAGYGLNMATAIIASIAIGIVVDDTIHYFSHFRDELLQTRDPKKAMMAALTRVGKALFLTTVILVAGFGVFLFSESGIMSSYGVLSGTAVLVALIGDLLLGPVLLSRLSLFHGKAIDLSGRKVRQ